MINAVRNIKSENYILFLILQIKSFPIYREILNCEYIVWPLRRNNTTILEDTI